VTTVDGHRRTVSSPARSPILGGHGLEYALVGTPGTDFDKVPRRRGGCATPGRPTRTRPPRSRPTSGRSSGTRATSTATSRAAATPAIQILYELAARSDCTGARPAREPRRRHHPTQNPTAATATPRTNGYGFDMNRGLVRPDPTRDRRQADAPQPVPPGPVHRRATSRRRATSSSRERATRCTTRSRPASVTGSTNLYGPAMPSTSLRRRHAADPTRWDYFNYDTYDLFYMGYGRHVPTTGFHTRPA
jgi:hypothetical protein